MDFLKQWAYCVCITLVIAVIFSLLAPKGRMSKLYKMLISLFIFISFLYPLKDFDIADIKIDDIDIDYTYSDEYSNSYEIMINNQVKNFLNDNDIIGCSVSSEVEIKNDEITIQNVQVAVPDEYDITEIKNMIFDSLGINAKVIRIGQ
jgi:hypothetical protein